MASPIQKASLDHVELVVPDRAEAAAWYRDFLGLSPAPGTQEWAQDPRGPLMISADGGRTCLALFQGQPGPSLKGFRRVAFGVSAEEFLAFVETAHQRHLDPLEIQDHDISISVYFRDPYGHELEVTTYDHQSVRDRLKF